MSKQFVGGLVLSALLDLDQHTQTALAQINDLYDLKLKTGASENLLTIQNAFWDIYQLMQPLRGLTNREMVEQGKLPKNMNSVSFEKLAQVLQVFEDCSLQQGSKKDIIEVKDPNENELIVISKLKEIILAYAVLLCLFLSIDMLLLDTLPLAQHVSYYSGVMDSNFAFMLYCLSNSPIKLCQLAEKLAFAMRNREVSAKENAPDWLSYRFKQIYKDIIFLRGKAQEIFKETWTKALSPSVFHINMARSQSRGPHRVQSRLHITGAVKTYVSVMLGVPSRLFSEDIKGKTQTLMNLERANASKIGLLVSHFSNSHFSRNVSETGSLVKLLRSTFDGCDDEELNVDSGLESIYKFVSVEVPAYKHRNIGVMQQSAPPRFLARYWIPVVLFLVYVPSTTYAIASNRAKILDWVRKNLVDTAKGFWHNWIVTPLGNIIATVKHDDDSRIAIMSQESLTSDLDSLERMVLDYSMDKSLYKGQNVDELRKKLSQMVKEGDLTPVMKDYERDLRAPLKSLVKGDLIRNILIQIQKTKVDGSVAMSGIDKLLKSQELVFGIVAASPSCVVLYWLTKMMINYLKTGYWTKFSMEKQLSLSRSMGEVHRILNLSLSQQRDYVGEGMLIIETVSLRKDGCSLLPRNRRKEWLRDCSDLIDGKLNTVAKINTIIRMWQVYRVYLIQ